MTLPYKRNFTIGRQSEQFLNEQLHIIFEALKNINYRKNENKGADPDAIVDGALWFDKIDNLLKYYDMRTLSWKTVFQKKFQITDQILDMTMPASPIPGQLWIYNGVLMYFDGASWVPIKAMIQDESQWSNAAFENFMIVTPLNPSPNAIVEGEQSDIDISKLIGKPDDTHKNTNVIEPRKAKWGTKEWTDAEVKEPTSLAVPDDKLKSQFVIPNITTDRIFLDHLFNTDYEKKTKVCIHYPTKDVYNKTVSCVHLNPGKLTSIKKRFVKVDKAISTINIPAYNTEFYGYVKGKIGGRFLIESNSQDHGDYIPSGDHIILNYNATQAYDYILAITYDFSWINSSGKTDHWNSLNPKKSYYIANLKEPINVHADGLKIEESTYDIDFQNKTVTINDKDADNVDIQMWSPYKKQFGYIRETDLEGNGIIKLKKRVAIPLVFVGGVLIHPLYGGLKFKDDTIIVPNHSGRDTMRNMAWCVVDLFSANNEIMYSEKGHTSKFEASLITGPEDYLDGQGNFIMHGDLSAQADADGFRDFVLASGTITGFEGVGIKYNNKKISEKDGIILFIDGFMIHDEDIIRHHEEGYLEVLPELTVGQEYLLLRDNDKRLYTESMLQEAYSTGYLDESLVYLNGEMLVNEGCLATICNETSEIAEGSVDNEIKYFISNEDESTGTWKIYNEYIFEWEDIPEAEAKEVEKIGSSYSNQLTSIKINVPYSKDDKLDIFTFKFSNSASGIYKYGEAVFVKNDENDGLQIYRTGNDNFAYGQSNLNLYRNGIKLVPGIDYKELSELNYVKMIKPVLQTDLITYVIEPIEAGETYGHETILLSKENAIQPNIYKIEENDSVPDLYPGRLTVYVNGLRLPKEDWTLLDNKRIMLKYINYKALGSADNFPEDVVVKANDKQTINIRHNYPDYIMIEIRKDYDRKERTIELKEEDNIEIYLDKYNIDTSILETKDEVLFYLNGQYLNISRSKSQDYKLDKYKGCIAILNPSVVEILSGDLLKRLLDRNSLAYASWKARHNNKEYSTEQRNILTMVWR